MRTRQRRGATLPRFARQWAPSRVNWPTLVVRLVALSMVLATPVLAQRVSDEPPPALDWHILARDDEHGRPAGSDGGEHGPLPSERVAAGDRVRPVGGSVPRPVDRTDVQPSPHLIVVPRGSSQPSSHRASGTASWYCGHGSACTRGFDASCRCAAAGPSIRRLLGPAWRGRSVLVRSGPSSVRVRLVDWCACPGGRLLDLYSDAFQRLAPLSRGLVKVTVEWR